MPEYYAYCNYCKEVLGNVPVDDPESRNGKQKIDSLKESVVKRHKT